MSTAQFRPDYAKFLFNLPRGLFASYYTRLNEASHERKFHGDWLKSHKVTALPCQNPDYENTIIEIWGEWSGLVTDLPFSVWGPSLRRFDVRAIVWDADEDAVLAVGQRLQRSDIGYNVEVFNSKPASKRMGRDRGGKGYRIGSRKSDVCSVVYKRTGEPVAMEFRFQGQALRAMVENTLHTWQGHEAVRDLWRMMVERCESAGQRRLQRCLERAGIGTYWPTYAKEDRDDYDQLQTSFAATLGDGRSEADEYEWYMLNYGEAHGYAD